MSNFAGKFAALLLGAGVVLSACSGGAADTAASQQAESAPELGGTISTTGSADAADGAGGTTKTNAVDVPVALPRTDDTSASEPVPESTPTETVGPAESLTDEGVLAAAVIILSDGDLEGAIADGVVSEAEAEAALAAIEQGTLDQYAG